METDITYILILHNSLRLKTFTTNSYASSTAHSFRWHKINEILKVLEQDTRARLPKKYHMDYTFLKF